MKAPINDHDDFVVAAATANTSGGRSTVIVAQALADVTAATLSTLPVSQRHGSPAMPRHFGACSATSATTGSSRFVRPDAARARDDGGSGLGLAIVAELVRAHGGSVLVGESALGGVCVEVTLPGPQGRASAP